MVLGIRKILLGKIYFDSKKTLVTAGTKQANLSEVPTDSNDQEFK